MIGSGKFQDLAPRFGSAIIMAAVGIGAIWAGGVWFLLLVALIVAGMIWELHAILTPEPRGKAGLVLGAMAGGAVLLSGLVPVALALPFALLPSIAGIGLLRRNRSLFGGYGALIVLAGFGLFHLRDEFGLIWIVWLVAVVVASDVLGYFAGRVIGGPKFWPRVSPKKTWSGTIAGWVGAAAVGFGIIAVTGARIDLVGLSIAAAMAAQLGDMAESAVKRKMGVKDASNLIPGHGGLLDRFDGMLGAAIFLLLVERLADFPPVPGTAF
ncbi:phosphatidate cytidylyltransferase [Plastorhodobacter daqingensis]|uniref:Phosphatidate cytidylyltransferase n=1 Tax=Plastorhodobacter daqingensis TaxID=1387281 RepID=A0ABW2UID1_9RHOB